MFKGLSVDDRLYYAGKIFDVVENGKVRPVMLGEGGNIVELSWFARTVAKNVNGLGLVKGIDSGTGTFSINKWINEKVITDGSAWKNSFFAGPIRTSSVDDILQETIPGTKQARVQIIGKDGVELDSWVEAVGKSRSIVEDTRLVTLGNKDLRMEITLIDDTGKAIRQPLTFTKTNDTWIQNVSLANRFDRLTDARDAINTTKKFGKSIGLGDTIAIGGAKTELYLNGAFKKPPEGGFIRIFDKNGGVVFAKNVTADTAIPENICRTGTSFSFPIRK